MKVGGIKFGQTTKVKLVGKGSKSRQIPISHEVANLLRYHIKENDFEGRHDDWLFASQLGGKMITACISNLVDKYVTEAKNAYPNLFPEPKYSPHSFRHSKAVHMVESGTQLIYIRNFLGCAFVQSTEIYARVGQEKLINILTERSGSAQEITVVEKAQSEPYPKFLSATRHK